MMSEPVMTSCFGSLLYVTSRKTDAPDECVLTLFPFTPLVRVSQAHPLKEEPGFKRGMGSGGK